MKRIPLTKNKFAIVDDNDFEHLNQWKWMFGSRRYAIRNTHYRDETGKRHTKVVWMHREIVKTPNGFQTDHINGDSLDNRRVNLRIVTARENVRNSIIPIHNTSGYKGVSETKRGLNKKWESYITINNQKKHLGYFSSKEEAGEVYNRAAKEFFGEYSKLNNFVFFEYEYLPTIQEVREHIRKCESFHTQQAIYSTFHDALTQVCYGCKKVRSTIYKK